VGGVVRGHAPLHTHTRPPPRAWGESARERDRIKYKSKKFKPTRARGARALPVHFSCRSQRMERYAHTVCARAALTRSRERSESCNTFFALILSRWVGDKSKWRQVDWGALIAA